MDHWDPFAPRISARLTADDDRALWRTVVDTIVADALHLARASTVPFVVELGVCSTWRRPHQTRWTADGGFAWPEGYDDTASLPRLDWAWRWRLAGERWVEASPDLGGVVRLRVAVPARTARHAQAAVHTVWIPGSPVDPRKRAYQLYGFRRGAAGSWRCTATSGDELYEHGPLS